MPTRDPRRSHYGTPGGSIHGEERARIIALIKEGRTRNEIRELTGRGGATISGIAKAEGLEFRQRSKVAAATEARRIDRAAARADLLERDYAYLRRIQDQRVSTRHKTLIKDTGGGERVAVLDFVPPVDARNLADVYARITQSVARMEAIDADRGADDAKALLTDLGKALGVQQPDA